MISAAATRNPAETLPTTVHNIVSAERRSPGVPGPSPRAGDRGRTGDVQLGKETEAKVENPHPSG
jgi:hypothetical protein